MRIGQLLEGNLLQGHSECRAADGQRRFVNDRQMGRGVDDSFAESGAEMLGHGKTFERFLLINVDMIEVAASAGAKGGDELVAEGLAQRLLQIKRIIGAVLRAAYRVRMHRKDSCAGE